MTKLEDNIEKYSKRGMIPAVTKGKKRWRVTNKEGNQEILLTSSSLHHRLSKGDIVKVEKNIEKYYAEGKKLKSKYVGDWKDVTEYYKI